MFKNILIVVLVLTIGLLYNLYDKTSTKKDKYKTRIDTLGKQNNNLQNNLKESKLNNDEKDFYLNLVSKYSNKLYFKKIEQSKLNINQKNYSFKKFQTFYLRTSKFPNSSGNAYLGYKNNSLFLVSGDGIFLSIDFKQFDNDEFDAAVIKTNIKDLIKFEKYCMDPEKTMSYIAKICNLKLLPFQKEKLQDANVPRDISGEFNLSLLNSNNLSNDRLETLYNLQEEFLKDIS